MNLVINREKKKFEQVTNLEDILLQLGIKSFDGMAVAVNEQVVPKPGWKDCRPVDEDHITIIRAVQGG